MKDIPFESYFSHTTEVIENLIHSKSGDYLDCTFGVGGHSKILENLNNDGSLNSIDKDPKVFKFVNQIKIKDFNLKILNLSDASNFPTFVF